MPGPCQITELFLLHSLLRLQSANLPATHTATVGAGATVLTLTCALCRQYAHASSVLHEKLQERIVLAKQMELIIRTADQLTMGLSQGLDTFTRVDQLPAADEDEELS